MSSMLAEHAGLHIVLKLMFSLVPPENVVCEASMAILRGPAPIRAADIMNTSCYLLDFSALFLFGYFISPLHLEEEKCPHKRSLLGHTFASPLDVTMVFTFS